MWPEAQARPASQVVLVSGILGAYAAAVAVTPRPLPALLISVPLGVALCWWVLLAPARWIFVLCGAAVLLPPLPVALGGNGAHPAVAVAGIGLWAGLLRMRDFRIRVDLLSVSLILYFFTLLASVSLAVWYSGLDIAAGSLARVCLFGISIYLFFYLAWNRGLAGESDRLVRFLFWIATASAAFACVDFYFQFPAPSGFGPQFVWLASGVYRRAQGVFYEASTLGNFCAFFLVMIAAALLRPRAGVPVPRAALLCGGAVFSAALMFSYSRASIVNLLAALAGLLWLHRGRLRIRRLATDVFAFAAAGSLAAYVFLPSLTTAWLLRIRMSLEYSASATNAVLSGRLENWAGLVGLLSEHPWHMLFGIGYKTLPFSSVLGHSAVADNMYLSMLIETGLVGLAALLIFSMAILRAAHRASLSTNPWASFLGTWVFCFWLGQLFQMMSGDLLTYWRVLPVYFCVLAIAVREAHGHSLCRPV